MEKTTSVIMVCDRIEEGRFCILTDEKKNVLSVPLQNLSAVPIEHEVYTVSMDSNGRVTLAPAFKEKEELLCQINTLRSRLLSKKTQEKSAKNKNVSKRKL